MYSTVASDLHTGTASFSPSLTPCQVTQLTNMLDSLLVKEVPEFEALEAFFLQAIYWSLGAGLIEDARIKFDTYVKYLASLTTVDTDNPPAKAGERGIQLIACVPGYLLFDWSGCCVVICHLWVMLELAIVYQCF